MAEWEAGEPHGAATSSDTSDNSKDAEASQSARVKMNSKTLHQLQQTHA